VAEQVELATVIGGGHYFARTRPEQVAEILRLDFSSHADGN
jgi:hypothetical protein